VLNQYARKAIEFNCSLNKKKASNKDAYNHIDDFEEATLVTSTVTISFSKKKVWLRQNIEHYTLY